MNDNDLFTLLVECPFCYRTHSAEYEDFECECGALCIVTAWPDEGTPWRWEWLEPDASRDVPMRLHVRRVQREWSALLGELRTVAEPLLGLGPVRRPAEAVGDAIAWLGTLGRAR